MSTPPEPPNGPTGGFTVRARAKVGGSRIRPEVADALGGLEQSLVEVAAWEAVQAPPWAETPLSEVDEGDPLLVAPDGGLAGADEAADDFDGPDGAAASDGEAGGAATSPVAAFDAALPEGADDPFDERSFPPPLANPGILLTAFPEAQEVDDLLEDGALLDGARGSSAGETQHDRDAAEAARRRRNGRVLTWAGVVVLATVAALFVIQPLDDGDDAGTDTSTTVDDTLLDADLTTTSSTGSTLAPVVVTPPVEVTTTTVAARSGSGRRTPPRRSTTPGTTATTQAAPTITGLPGQPCSVRTPGCNTTVTTAAPTPTTQPAPPTTVTTINNPGTFPPAPGDDPNDPDVG